MYQHFMLDLETLDTKSTAAIIQIACVPFNFNQTEMSQQVFCLNVDQMTSVALGGTVSKSTLSFWREQSKEVRESVFSDQKSLAYVLKELTDFIQSFAEGDFRVWSHATFDPPILQHAYTGANQKAPFKYWQYMDIRTLEFLAGNPQVERTHKDLKHNALADCYSQINYVIELAKIAKYAPV